MDTYAVKSRSMARRDRSRRAMTLLELSAVVAMFGLLAIAAVSRLGHTTLGNGGAEGFARKIALSLTHARRSTIASGDNHYLEFTADEGNVVSYSLFRRTGGSTQIDQSHAVPQDVVVTSSNTTLEFDFEGAGLAGDTVTIDGPQRSWVVSVVAATGAVQVIETTP